MTDCQIRLHPDSRYLNLSQSRWPLRLQPEQLQLVVSDEPGDDPDGVATTLCAAGLSVFGARMNFLGFTINRQPADRRAALQSGVLSQIGLGESPVSIGSGLGFDYRNGQIIDESAWHMEFKKPEVNGAEQLRYALRASADCSVTLLAIAGMTDLARLVREYPRTAVRKLKQIAVMGGVLAEGDCPKLDARGYLIPDDSAANHAHDLVASHELFEFAQANGIPLLVLSRHAATAAAVPQTLYEILASTEHPVGVQLRNVQRKSIQTLWTNVSVPVGTPGRVLPDRCDRQWFWTTFCSGTVPAAITAESDVWEHIARLNLYDPLTLLLCVPELAERYYSPTAVLVTGRGMRDCRSVGYQMPQLWQERLAIETGKLAQLLKSGHDIEGPQAREALGRMRRMAVNLGVAQERGDFYQMPLQEGDMELPPGFRSTTATHRVVGVSPSNTGVKDGRELANYLCEAMYHACMSSNGINDRR